MPKKIDEQNLLENFAKAFGKEHLLEKLGKIEVKKTPEEKKVDEQRLLENFAKAFGKEQLLEKLEKKKPKRAALSEAISAAISKIDKAPDEPIIVEEVITEIPAVMIEQGAHSEPLLELAKAPQPELPEDNIITKSVIALSKANQQTVDIQTIADKLPPGIQKELDIIRKSIADFHRFAQNHSQMGGGGTNDISDIRLPTKLITTSHYDIVARDYYIGVNYAGLATITLPINQKEGKCFIVKDERGEAENAARFITIQSAGSELIDTEDKVLLQFNYGSLTFVWRGNSWRVV